MKKNHFTKYLLLAVLAVFCSCEKDLPTQIQIKAYEFSSLDENGGSWKPILLEDADQITIPAPEATTSLSFMAELGELKSLSLNLTSEQKQAVDYWGSNPLVRWNEIARELAAKYNLTPAPNPDGTYTLPDPANPGNYPKFPFAHPPYTSRMLAYWSAAQFDGMIAAWHYKYLYNRPPHYQTDATLTTRLPQNGLPSYPSDGAVIAAISQAILTAMFPLEKDFLSEKAAEHKNSLQWAGLHVDSDILAGDSLGRAVAAVFISRSKTDGMKSAQTPKPVADSLRDAAQARWGWHWENLEIPQRPVGITPFFGQVKPWCIPSVESVRPGPPPAPGSEEFEAAARELKDIANSLTNEQRKIANFWSDGLNTYTPPGHWNRLASDFIVEARYNPIRTARTFAYLNMAIMDAGVSCWDAKYYYHYPRPSQAIPGFKTILGIPNFPSYTSGHSTFSAAAAAVLGHIFPSKQAYCDAWAAEAALSRVYAGIHFNFDATVGLEQGRNVAQYAIAKAQADGGE